jgi:hypothetical protein
MQTDDLRLGLGGLGADCERQPHPIVSNGPELSRRPGTKVGIDWRFSSSLLCLLMTRIVARRRV